MKFSIVQYKHPLRFNLNNLKFHRLRMPFGVGYHVGNEHIRCVNGRIFSKVVSSCDQVVGCHTRDMK